MVSQAAPLPLDDQMRALEELRTADRLLGSVLGTLGFVKRQQLLDTVGFSMAEGFLGEQTNWVEIERWGVAEPVVNRVFDVFATMRAGRNVRVAGEVGQQVRTPFASVRKTNPELSSRVAPSGRDRGRRRSRQPAPTMAVQQDRASACASS